MPNLNIDLRYYRIEINKFIDLQKAITSLPAKYQKLIAEIIFLQIFSKLENTLIKVTIKLLCNATYLDGSYPQLTLASNNRTDAINNMKTHGRSRPKNILRWTIASEIQDNIIHLMDNYDHFYITLRSYSSLLTEMRKIRNRIAHNNESVRSNYRDVLRIKYGAVPNNITPGVLLLSTSFTPNLLEHYLLGSRILIEDLLKG